MMYADSPDEPFHPTNGEDRTIFHIPMDNYPKFKAQIEKLSRRSEKLIGQPITPVPVGRKSKKQDDGSVIVFIEVFLNAETPVIDGWTFAATIDHSNEAGNLLRAIPNLKCDVPEQYRTAEPVCDHCKVRRYRRDTYLLHNAETNEWKQVGKTCLKDFFGHDPSKLASMAEILGFATECGHGAEHFVGGDLRYLDTETFLTHAAWAIRQYGWVSAAAARGDDTLTSTRARATLNMFPKPGLMRVEPSQEDIDVATAALEWAQNLENKSNLSDYEHNVLVVAKSPVVEMRAAGIAASIVYVYLREANKKVVKSNSNYVGTIGDRMEFGTVEVVDHRTMNGQFGLTHIYTFVTESGDRLVWFSTKQENVIAGDKVTIRGTVMKHSEFKDVKQTTINRCKVVKV